MLGQPLTCVFERETFPSHFRSFVGRRVIESRLFAWIAGLLTCLDVLRFKYTLGIGLLSLAETDRFDAFQNFKTTFSVRFLANYVALFTCLTRESLYRVSTCFGIFPASRFSCSQNVAT
ncbi:hypothetical protein L596_011724 [Steinernema carpocapsae]|uniref:Uncharacterized protein n=1 Tax=Steinernema carpocapsae TaxID=34508 RepID=A0A4U5NUV2_STECR|nr:hypothetical protein L596_011724 [Steinernema carpocapsae]